MNRAPSSHDRWAAGITFAICAGFLALLLTGLDRFPPVQQDEPWIASAAAHLAETGTYGSPLFTGFYGAERHVFMFPPLLPLLEAGTFAVAGVDVVTMRLPGVLAALLIVIAASLAAVRLGGPACGVLAAALLVCLSPAGRWNGTAGVPLLDVARVARYDILVPALGLAALLVFERARAPRSRALLCLGGALTGLATLAHLYGAFWLAGLLGVVMLRPASRAGRGRDAGWLVAGFALALLPALIWIGTAWTDFLGQQQILRERFGLLDARFYLDNLLREPERYRQLLTNADPLRSMFTRPGLWIVLAGTPLALVHLIVWRRTGRDRVDFTIAVLLISQIALFALLVRLKTFSYLISLWPLVVVLIAATAIRLWHGSPVASGAAPDAVPAGSRRPPSRGRRATRFALVLLFAAGFVEGGIRIGQWMARMSGTTRYADVAARIAEHVPPGVHVLGLHHWWLGLQEHRFTSWLLPVWWNDARYTRPPLPFDEALERVDPAIIIVDPPMAAYLAEIARPDHAQHDRFVAWRAWAERHAIDRVARITDPTWGTIEIWRVPSGP